MLFHTWIFLVFIPIHVYLALRAGRVPGKGSLILAWIALTAVTLAVGWLIA